MSKFEKIKCWYWNLYRSYLSHKKDAGWIDPTYCTFCGKEVEKQSGKRKLIIRPLSRMTIKDGEGPVYCCRKCMSKPEVRDKLNYTDRKR